MNEILTQEKSIYIQIKEMIENDILRNILYDGVWKHYRKIQEKKSEEKEDDKESL